MANNNPTNPNTLAPVPTPDQFRNDALTPQANVAAFSPQANVSGMSPAQMSASAQSLSSQNVLNVPKNQAVAVGPGNVQPTQTPTQSWGRTGIYKEGGKDVYQEQTWNPSSGKFETVTFDNTTGARRGNGLQTADIPTGKSTITGDVGASSAADLGLSISSREADLNNERLAQVSALRAAQMEEEKVIRDTFNARRATLGEQQTEQDKSQDVLAYRLGRKDTPYGVAEMANLQNDQARVMNELAVEESSLIQKSKQALAKGEYQASLDMRDEADRMLQRRIQTEQLNFQKQTQIREENKFALEYGKEVFGAMAESDKKPSQEVFDWYDTKYNSGNKGLGEALFASASAKKAAEDAKTEAAEIEQQSKVIDAWKKAAPSLPDDYKFSVKIGDSTLSLSAKDFKDNKFVQVQTDKGHQLFTYDSNGKVINTQTLGRNYVAPQLNQDTGQFVAYVPGSDTNVVVNDAGDHGEGVSAQKDYTGIVNGFKSQFGEPTQEPGGDYSHGNLLAWDFRAKVGSNVPVPVENGYVVGMRDGVKVNYKEAGQGNVDYGNFVDIMDEDKGYVVRIAHLSEVKLKPGQRVTSKDLVGLSGNTGLSTGPHVHLEFLTADGRPILPNNDDFLSGKTVLGANDAESKPQVVKDSVKQYEAETGYKYDPNSKRSQDKFAEWNKEQRDKTVKEEAAKKEADIKNRDFAFSVGKDFQDKANVKAFNQVQPQVQNLNSALTRARDNIAANKPIGPSDQTIITGFNKLLDPGSVVRESEYARTPEGQALIDRLSGAIGRIQKGGSGLTLESLEETVGLANDLFNNYQNNYKNEVSALLPIIKKYGLDPSLVLGAAAKPVYARNSKGEIVEVSPNEPEYIDALTTGEIK